MKKRPNNKYGINPKDSNFKKFLKKFWWIVWKDDSFKGWIISIIFLFIVIKGIFFPVMSLATGTKLPLVIVESCSMYHEGNIFSDAEEWFENHKTKYWEHKISKEMFLEYPFKKGFNKGDILFVTGTKPENLKKGDVIIFAANYKSPIIHRIVEINEKNGEYTFSTLGDNNPEQIYFETSIKENQIVGKARANIAPYLGWIKLIFFEFTQPSGNKGFCEAI
jgi:signal peptidase I